MDKVPLRVSLEHHQGAVGYSAIDEVVHQKIDSHSRGQSEHGREAEGERVAGFEHRTLGFDLRAAIKTDRSQRALFGADAPRIADAVAAVRVRQNDSLMFRAEREKELDR